MSAKTLSILVPPHTWLPPNFAASDVKSSSARAFAETPGPCVRVDTASKTSLGSRASAAIPNRMASSNVLALPSAAASALEGADIAAATTASAATASLVSMMSASRGFTFTRPPSGDGIGAVSPPMSLNSLANSSGASCRSGPFRPRTSSHHSAFTATASGAAPGEAPSSCRTAPSRSASLRGLLPICALAQSSGDVLNVGPKAPCRRERIAGDPALRCRAATAACRSQTSALRLPRILRTASGCFFGQSSAQKRS
mmetsp:Transcript_107347/g.303499  ORF Transcript_107347/g.303499 Transcript_107347/m.303499 type:complete len:256 (-) Transcript_107347:1156-1923(-)